MGSTSKRYLKLKPTTDSRLSFNDSKQLITYLSELPKPDHFELLIKSQTAGIELLLGVDSSKLETIKKEMYTVSPKISIEAVKKSEAILNKPTHQLNYRFNRHYAYPLSSELVSNDSLTKLMRSLAQIKDQEVIELKLSAEAYRPLKAKLLRQRLLSGSSPTLIDPGPLAILKRAISLVARSLAALIKSTLYLIENLIYSKSYDRHSTAKPQKIVNPKSVMLLDKLYGPLFKTYLSLSIKASSPKRALVIAKDINLAINDFAAVSGYQRFKAVNKRVRPDTYSASDLAAFYHIRQTELLSGIYQLEQFKSLPLPSELTKDPSINGLVLGANNYQGSNQDIVLSGDARKRHLYITGATGSGKSTLMANLILQDIASGKGISLIDPHGDLASEIVKRIPEARLKDLVYFDPSSYHSAVSINLLEINAPKGTAAYRQQADQLTEGIISLFRKIFAGEDIGGHRIEYILRNTIHTALNEPGSNIFTIFRLLTDSSYRLKVVSTLTDQNLINFWRNELGRAGDYQRVKMTAGVTSKIGRFLFFEPAKRVFGQTRSTLDVAKLMNNRQILICDFAKGKLGEDGSRLFSAAMLTKLQLAALSRVNRELNDRPDHYLYADEFQNHAPSIILQMLSESRKYGLYLTMAEQSPYQQDSQSSNAMLANIGNLICFRSTLPKDERLVMPQFEQYLSTNDLNNLPAYHFYFKTTAVQASPPTSGQSYPLPLTASDLDAKQIKRSNYTRPVMKSAKIQPAI